MRIMPGAWSLGFCGLDGDPVATAGGCCLALQGNYYGQNNTYTNADIDIDPRSWC